QIAMLRHLCLACLNLGEHVANREPKLSLGAEVKSCGVFSSEIQAFGILLDANGLGAWLRELHRRQPPPAASRKLGRRTHIGHDWMANGHKFFRHQRAYADANT